jgi:chemotaxis protein MotB
MARKQQKPPEGLPEWFATYSDMVTLLLTFFVLLFSMASIDNIKFNQVAQSLASSFSMIDLYTGDKILNSSGNTIFTVDFSNPSNQRKPAQNEKYIEAAEEMVVDAEQRIADKKMDIAKEEIRQAVEAQGLEDKIQIIEEKDFIIVRLDSEVFFDSGKANIRPEGVPILDALAGILKGIDNEILVSGHTDNVPISTELYKSNWELSTARATTVVRYLLDTHNLDPTKFTATGNGEYRPIGDNSTAEGRQMNRRIEVKIMK